MPVTLEKLQTIHQKVRYCLSRYPETRNSDIDLFARLCENFYPPFERPLYNWRDLAGAMHSVPSLDHIARCRRKVVENSGYTKYLPTVKSIALHRGYSEKIFNEYAHKNGIREEQNFDRNIPVTHDDNGQLIS